MVHVVVVDDDPFNLEVLSRLLKFYQFGYTTIQDTSQMEDIIRDLPQVDVILLDLEMPYMTGFEALPRLRALLGRLPIVAYSVHTGEMNTVRKMGFQDFIGKPIDSLQFREQLQRVLDGEEVWET